MIEGSGSLINGSGWPKNIWILLIRICNTAAKEKKSQDKRFPGRGGCAPHASPAAPRPSSWWAPRACAAPPPLSPPCVAAPPPGGQQVPIYQYFRSLLISYGSGSGILGCIPIRIQGFWWTKKLKKIHSRNFFFFSIKKTTIYLSLGRIKDVQVTEEAFGSQKRTSSTSKHEISKKNPSSRVIFALLDPDPDSEYRSWSTDLIKSGSNTDPDPRQSHFYKDFSAGLATKVMQVAE